MIKHRTRQMNLYQCDICRLMVSQMWQQH